MNRYFLYPIVFLVPHSVVCNWLNSVKCMPCILYYDTCNLKHIFFCRKMWCVQSAIFWLFCKCRLIHKEVTIQCTIKSPSFLLCNVTLLSLSGPRIPRHIGTSRSTFVMNCAFTFWLLTLCMAVMAFSARKLWIEQHFPMKTNSL